MNPYHKFLDLPEAETRPDHYGLLGVPRFTDDVKQIHAAAVTRGQQLRDWDNSKFYLEANTVLDEVAHASLVLEDPIRKAAYDAELRQTLGIVSRPNPIPSTNEIVATSPPKRVSKGLVSPQPTPSDKPADVVYALEPSLVRPKNIEELFLRRRSSGWRVFAASSVGVCVAALLGLAWAMRSGRTVSSAISSPVTATSTNQVAPTPASLALSPLTTVTLQAGDRRRVAVQVNRTACQGATLVRAHCSISRSMRSELTVNGGDRTGHWAAQDLASGEAPSAMAGARARWLARAMALDDRAGFAVGDQVLASAFRERRWPSL